MTAHWLDKYSGQTIVVKFGGNAMVDEALTSAFCDDIVSLVRAGIRVVVTHGGGPQISSELAARAIESKFRGGLRVTSLPAVAAVHDVLVRIGVELVASLEVAGVSAVSFAGDERGLFAARKVGTVVNGEMIDLGQVGEALSVETSMISATLDAGGVPVISAIGTDVLDGELLNINADAAASSLAVALAADWLLLLTDVDGLYRDWPNRNSLIRTIDVEAVDELLPRLESGMIPKVTAARDAILGGVAHVAIINGRIPHVVVSAPFGATGTMITSAERINHE